MRAREREAKRRTEVAERSGQSVHLNRPGETNRQLAVRLRAEAAAAEAPAKPKRARTKKAAA